MRDSYNRSITYLRISVTDRCNLRCTYCMPKTGIRLLRHDQILSYEEITAIARAAADLGIEKIRLTGGEPLARKNISRLIRSLKKISGICEVALTSNGILLPPVARELKEAGLDRINISLDTLDPVLFRTITRLGDLDQALQGIESAQKAGFSPIKINMVVLPGINDGEESKMADFCCVQGLILQRIRRYVLHDADSIRGAYEAERPLPCSSCNRIRLTADGKLKPCLFYNQEIQVDPKNPGPAIRKSILQKPPHGAWCDNRKVYQIGG